MSSGDRPSTFIPPLAPDPFDDPINERPPYDWREKRIQELERKLAESEAGRARLEAAMRLAITSMSAERFNELASECGEFMTAYELQIGEVLGNFSAALTGHSALEAVKGADNLLDRIERKETWGIEEVAGVKDKLRAAFFLEAGE